ncbi:MAG: hypothetical protein ACFFG0_03435 [Candidatus Thorarchaeota archaeon]
MPEDGLGKFFFANGKTMITEDGGIAIKLTNKTGGNSIKGYLVSVYDATAIDNAVALSAVDEPDCIGVFYEAGIADGSEAWVVISGIADVYFANDSTRGHIARVMVAADDNDTAGMAQSEALPSSPFATDKHFQEIGHVLESRGTAGLAKCLLHFN